MDFEREIAGFRRELLAHCYRMTGSTGDAEDALQDAMIRAWKGLASFEGRASLRTWLYRIATNACIDLLSSRRARTMPEREVPPGHEGEHDAPWLEPFPDSWLDTRAPDALYASRESVRLAFVVALQVLPPRQRAVLILRDVVGLSAEETAEALEMTVAAANSALQRARDTVEQQPRARAKLPEPEAVRGLLDRYLQVWEAGDAQGLIALLRDDAIISMPPVPLWARGAEAIAALCQRFAFIHELRLVPCTVSGAPAFAIYRREGDVFAYNSISVLDIDGDKIAAIHTFLAADPARYDLAPRL